MKRTAAAFLLAAGLGGCMSPDSTKKLVAPDRAAAPAVGPAAGRDVRQAEARTLRVDNPRQGARAAVEIAPGSIHDPAVRQAAGFARVRGPGCGPGVGIGGCAPGVGISEDAYGPRQGYFRTMLGGGGILPAPGMGAPGVVAGQGFIGPGLGMNGLYANQRTSIRFAAPGGMKIAFQDPAQQFVDAGREAPVRYNFPQGAIYRLRLNGIPNRPGKTYYPTLEVYPSTLKTVTFLSHSTVPVGFSDEDFEQVNSGNLVVKVVYLPDPAFQDLAAAEEIVSTRLEPGVDPIAEANRRGTILVVIRMGNIDLEDPTTPAMDAPPSNGPLGGFGPGAGPIGGFGPGAGPIGGFGPGAGPSGSPLPSPRPVPGSGGPMPLPVPKEETRPAPGPMPGGPSRVPSTLPPLQVPSPN